MKELRWLLMNGFFAALIYAGFVAGIDGAKTLAVFIGWLTSICAFFVYSETIVEKSRKEGKKRSVPMLVDVSFDLCVTFAFAYYGHVWLAGFYFIHIISIQGYWESVEKPKT